MDLAVMHDAIQVRTECRQTMVYLLEYIIGSRKILCKMRWELGLSGGRAAVAPNDIREISVVGVSRMCGKLNDILPLAINPN